MHRRLLTSLITLAMSAPVLLPQHALASTTATANLTGEDLRAGPTYFPGFPGGQINLTFSCSGQSLQSISFSVSGFASGPYPGTFTESGSGTFQPNPPATAITFSSTFTINSPAGTVTGTKTLSPDLGFFGGCSTDAGGHPFPFFTGFLRYSAQISASGGPATDEGISSVTVTRVAPSTTSPTSDPTFDETFSSAVERIGSVGTLIMGLGLPQGTATSLLAKVAAAQASLASGNLTAACNQLQALIHEAEAQSGKKLSIPQADAIIATTRGAMSIAGCP